MRVTPGSSVNASSKRARSTWACSPGGVSKSNDFREKRGGHGWTPIEHARNKQFRFCFNDLVLNRGGVQVGRRFTAHSSELEVRVGPVFDALANFVGCYEMNVSTDILPARFALVADSAGPSRFEVRYLDGDGRPSERILDASWGTEGGRAVIRTTGRGTLLTLVKTGSAVTAESPNGPRTGRVFPCR